MSSFLPRSLQCKQARSRAAGFSFVEAIFTIAIIGIMSSLVVAAISNASRDAHRVMARQQQATLQSAVTAWVMAQTRVVTPGPNEGQFISLESVRAAYNAQPTTRARFLQLLAPDDARPILREKPGFIDEVTAKHFKDYTTSSDRLLTAALDSADQYLTLPDWHEDEFPRVDLVNKRD